MTAPLRVLAVTSVGGACGIANYAEMVREFTAPHGVELVLSAEALDPAIVLIPAYRGTHPEVPAIVWLNYHRGLHSRWNPEAVQSLKGAGTKVVITFHDTYGESEPDALTRDLHDLADAFIVHEPCVGLPKAILIRQGVLPYAGEYRIDRSYVGWTQGRPVLGTCGFNFPWKNFKRLAEVTEAAGWAYLVLSNNATTRDEAEWRSLNPCTRVVPGFLESRELVQWLGACDATAFPYECANSGTSGAIRLGLAARKPVLAFLCRQFRDLSFETSSAIRWVPDFAMLPEMLRAIPIQRLDPGIAYLAHRDRWPLHGQKYADVFKGVVR